MKRLLALVLAVLMVVSLFAGCQKNDPAPTETEKPGTTEGKETKPEETKAPEKPKEIPTIHWYTVGGGPIPNYDSWHKQINAYLEEKIGVHLDYQIISFADWDSRSSNMIATNDPYDIVFGYGGDYRKYINMGAFLDITTLLEQTPELQKVVPEIVWKAATVNGSIYCVPNYKDISNTNFFMVNAEFCDKYCPEDYKNFHKLSDWTPALEAYSKDTGTHAVVTQGIGMNFRYDDLGLGFDGYGIDCLAEGTPKIVKTWETDYAKEHFDTLMDWISRGIMNDDGAVRKSVAMGESMFGVGQGWPSAWVSWEPAIYAIQWGDTFMFSAGCAGAYSAISSSSEHPVEALKLLELVNTDPYVRDLFAYGEEGYNWEYVDVDGMQKVHRIKQPEPWSASSYTQGQFFIQTPADDVEGNPMVDEVLVQNENAIMSPAIGFHPDFSEIQDTIDGLKAISHEYRGLINSGNGDVYANIAEYYSRMEEAGAVEVIAEVQRQLDDWYAANN